MIRLGLGGKLKVEKAQGSCKLVLLLIRLGNDITYITVPPHKHPHPESASNGLTPPGMKPGSTGLEISGQAVQLICRLLVLL